MDSIIFLPSVVLGLIFLMFYIIRCHRNKESLNLGIIINTFLLSGGVVCGILLMVGCVYEPAKTLLKGIDIYIFVGGIAVLFVSVQGIYNDVFSNSQKRNLTQRRNSIQKKHTAL